MKAIYILWLREVKRYFRSRARIVGALGQPLLFLLALGFGLGPVFERAGQGNYFQFLTPGIMAQGILFTSLFAGIQIIWDKQFGFLKETLVAPVSRLQIVRGKVAGGATVAVFQGIFIFILAFLVGFRPGTFALLPVTLLFMILIAILFNGIGTAIASFLNDMQGFQLIMNFLVMPLFFLSGALFPLNGLPRVLSIITAFDPLTYGVDGLRGSLTLTSHFSLTTDLFVLAILSCIALLIGSYLFSKIQL